MKRRRTKRTCRRERLLWHRTAVGNGGDDAMIENTAMKHVKDPRQTR